MRLGYVAGNGSYPSPAILRFTGAFEGDRPHGSLQIVGKLKDTQRRSFAFENSDVGQDAGVVDVSDTYAFITVAKNRQWDRKSLRTLA